MSNNKKGGSARNAYPPEYLVGMTGFEPAAPYSRSKCATRLRYIPTKAFYSVLPDLCQQDIAELRCGRNHKWRHGCRLSTMMKEINGSGVCVSSSPSTCKHSQGCRPCMPFLFVGSWLYAPASSGPLVAEKPLPSTLPVSHVSDWIRIQGTLLNCTPYAHVHDGRTPENTPS